MLNKTKKITAGGAPRLYAQSHVRIFRLLDGSLVTLDMPPIPDSRLPVVHADTGPQTILHRDTEMYPEVTIDELVQYYLD